MASEAGDRYALGRLILDYLRTFMWPAIAFAVVILFQDDVRKILESREVELAGVVRIGPQIEQLEKQANEEIADIRALLQAQQAGEGEAAPEVTEQVTADIENKLAKLSRNLTREVEQIQRTAPATAQTQAPAPAVAAATRVQKVSGMERRGFEALLERDVGGALQAFGEAFEAWPDYHNVSEIQKLLKKHKSDLSDPGSPAWEMVYRIILADLSWGLPSDLRPEFRKLAAASYK
ncbi:hypothetical protein [Pelagibius sp. Alg239-R121]|uniref:hypothetical protein n=1 Tax=Pelagibius sp. Alg239-R121 TaxID=2993448 RepID=UPI0024A787D5|nr:hypothetical protein [Pelagibius sp. Alg239-R121]